MPFLADPLAVLYPFGTSPGHSGTFWPAPPTFTVGPIPDDTEYARVKRRIDAVDTNRPDYDAVPEHDPDGTPWAA